MSNWKTTLAAVAPALATALGGPFAGVAVKTIGDALLGDGEHSVSSVAEAVMSAAPTELLALKDADNQFNLDMKALDVENTKSARSMAEVVGIAPQVILSAIYTIGYFWLLSQFLTGEISIPINLSGPFNILIGVMTAGQAQIMNFWFGSSSGSKEKTRKLK